jgi:hypothetical protein
VEPDGRIFTLLAELSPIGCRITRLAEFYPSLWTRCFPRDDRDGDGNAAYAAAACCNALTAMGHWTGS